MFKRIQSRLTPTQILVIGFAVMIGFGTALLNLPIATQSGVSVGVLDAFFTATSAVCVTGLAVVDTYATWSFFGQMVLLILFQIGGLGFMTITTTLFILLGKKIRLRERMIIQESLNQYTLAGMVRLTKNVILGTFLIESIGAIFLMTQFVPEYGRRGIFLGIFHSVSAFCNAGFDIMPGDSLTAYLTNGVVNLTVMGLIILGGLGFTVWVDIIKGANDKRLEHWTIKKTWQKFSLHTKLAISISFFLSLIGFLFFFLIEGVNPNVLSSATFIERFWSSLFQSITLRTAGFNTINQGNMSHASQFMGIILMFIGGSPAGTAGGIKTVTFGVVLLGVRSVIRAEQDVEAFNRRVSWDVVKRAMAIIVLSLGVVMVVTTVLSVIEDVSFLEILFESVSAFATVGLSLGITDQLSGISKVILAMAMFAGRLGPVTVAVALTIKSGNQRKPMIRKPEEKIMVG